jgi:hypothetical protein
MLPSSSSRQKTFGCVLPTSTTQDTSSFDQYSSMPRLLALLKFLTITGVPAGETKDKAFSRANDREKPMRYRFLPSFLRSPLATARGHDRAKPSWFRRWGSITRHATGSGAGWRRCSGALRTWDGVVWPQPTMATWEEPSDMVGYAAVVRARPGSAD